MSKQLIIDKCDDCLHFDNEYYDFSETCRKLDRMISGNRNYEHDIPCDCPLIEVNDDVDGMATNAG